VYLGARNQSFPRDQASHFNALADQIKRGNREISVTTKVLSTAAIGAKTDNLMGLKEKVIVGKGIPAGIGQRKFGNIIVTHKDRAAELESRQPMDSSVGGHIPPQPTNLFVGKAVGK
jgi:hypothetical protein